MGKEWCCEEFGQKIIITHFLFVDIMFFLRWHRLGYGLSSSNKISFLASIVLLYF